MKIAACLIEKIGSTVSGYFHPSLWLSESHGLLVQRQSSRRSTSDRKQRQEDPRCRPRSLGHTREGNTGSLWTQARGLSSSAPSTRLYPEIGRQDYAPARKRGKRSVRRPGKEMQGAPKHAEFSDWRDEFYAAALIRGGERSWISAAVSRSMTFIGPPQSGQR